MVYLASSNVRVSGFYIYKEWQFKEAGGSVASESIEKLLL